MARAGPDCYNTAMTAEPMPPTPEDERHLAALVAEILAAEEPAAALEDALRRLEEAQKPAIAAALYETVCYRVPGESYWLHFRMSRVYYRLGRARDDATFFHAAAAARLQPDWSGSDQAFRDMFEILRRRGRDRAALDLFRHQMTIRPDRPAATQDQLAPILQRVGEASAMLSAPPGPPDPGACRLHPAMPEETRAAWACPVFGGEMPYMLRPLASPTVRPAIAVAEFADAEILLWRDTVVVVDRAGHVAEDFCVGDYPGAIHARAMALERAGQSLETHDADEAVVISDHFPAPNICHFLYDQMTRLALYRRLGVDTGAALVVGPEPALPAQREILRRAAVTRYLGSDRVARVRCRRLWVSGNCRALCHPSHLGATWAIDFIRHTLGGQGQKGWRRLYLSRADAGSRRVANEDAVTALLEPHGFETIVPGRMSYDAQLAAFRQASHVVAPHGAALTHIVLCPAGAQVLEMFHPLYGTASYAAQAEAAGIRYAALVARDWESDAPELNDPSVLATEPSRAGDRHMCVDLEALSRYLATVT
jgi:capsular polysaccharide biosynthesis protein